MRRAGLLLLAACSPPEATITVDVGEPVAEVSPRFLSFAVDSAQVVGGVFWNPDPDGEPEIPVSPFDFDDPVLRARTAELSPAVLRIGGTAADFVYYDLEGTGELPGGYSLAMTADQWAGVVDFAIDLDLTLLFTLNAGPGPRESGGAWQPDNARLLVEDAVARGAPVEVWELGNEINGYPLMHGLALNPVEWGRDARTLRAMLDEAHPEGLTAGPSSAYWPDAGEFVPFTSEAVPAAGDALDVVTWHYYPQQSTRCPLQTVPAGPETLLDAEALDEVATWADEVEAIAGDRAVWLGETGHAQCGGAPGVSNRFASGFWWLDQLGLLAARGQQVVVRQTLSGSDYGLLADDGSFAPTPDWWVSVLHKRLVGPEVLAVSVDGAPGLRAYAHCALDSGVVLLLVNPTDEAFELGLEPDGLVEPWIFTGELDSSEVLLNDRLLELTPDGQVEILAPDRSRRGRMAMPARSYGFAVLPDAEGC